MIRPGVPISDIGRTYLAMVRDMGYAPAPWPLHGRGLGDDLPVLPSVTTESGATFEDGHVLILKPGAIPSGGDENAAERAGGHRDSDPRRRQAAGPSAACHH